MNAMTVAEVIAFLILLQLVAIMAAAIALFYHLKRKAP